MRGMATAAFDTFQAARALESAGVERTQAEAIAGAIQHRQDHATKSDLMELGTELRKEIGERISELRNDTGEFGTELRGRIDKLEAEMGELRSDNAQLRSEMAALETRLMNRIYVIAAGQAGLIAAFGLFT